MWPHNQEWSVTMRVVLYARVSTIDKDQNPEVQLKELREYCAARKWNATQELVDIGYSGIDDKRPKLNELIKLARARKIDCIVCWRMDRIGRSMKHMVLFLEEIQALGILFVSLTEGIDFSTPSGRFMSHILISVASLERDILIERTRAGLRFAVASGKKLGRPRKHDRDKIIEFRKLGYSYRKIADELNCAEGVVSSVLSDARKSGLNFESKSGVLQSTEADQTYEK